MRTVLQGRAGGTGGDAHGASQIKKQASGFGRGPTAGARARRRARVRLGRTAGLPLAGRRIDTLEGDRYAAPMADRVDCALDSTQRTRWVAVALLLMTMAFGFARTGRDALYFQGRGVRDLPKAYMALAVLALPTALLALAAMRRWGARPSRLVATSGMSAALAIYALVARPGGGAAMTGFFLLVPMAFGVLFSLAWLLGSDLLDGAPRTRLASSYGVLGAASIAGGVAAGAISRLLAPHVEPQRLIAAGAIALAASAVVLALAHRRFPLGAGTGAGGAVPDARLVHDLAALARTRYAALLTGIGMTGGLVGVLVEFQFYLSAATSGASGRQNASFFAGFYLVLNLAALLMQVYAMPRIQRALGVPGSLLVLPTALLGGSAALLANASLLARTVLRVTEGGLKSSLHRSTWEQAFVPFARGQRAAAKLLVDGAGARLAEGAAAGMVYVWLERTVGQGELTGHSARWVTWALLLTCAAWVALTQALRRTLRAATTGPGANEEFRLDLPLPDS